MSAKVMRVNKVEKHPNADSLFVHEMISVDNISYQIVANNTNLYSVGDNAIVVTSGSKLKDETYIGESKIRGVVSVGMALGKTDLPVGTDLTDEYCLPFFRTSWPDIESLFNVYKYMKENQAERVVSYISKIKLDGTNAGIQIFPNGDLIVQSRSDIITPDKDNKGFARWVKENEEYFKKLAAKDNFTIFGEWCGSGIGNGAISKIGRKIFCVFAIQYGDYLEINPECIKGIIPEHKDVFVLPFYAPITIDYTDEEKLERTVQVLNNVVREVEQCDPFVKHYFSVEGIGEGLVFYPLPENTVISTESILVSRGMYKEFVFKAKGEKHKVVKTKAPVQIDPEVAKSINEFVDLFVTENRLKQMAERVEGFTVNNTGNFLKVFNADVIKESEAELAASKMTWKDVASAVSTAARNWWLANCNANNC